MSGKDEDNIVIIFIRVLRDKFWMKKQNCDYILHDCNMVILVQKLRVLSSVQR